jgi:hypothetical protein
MPEPFLSQMNLNEHSPNIARVGRWEPKGYDVLQGIAGATPEKSIDLSELARSVPSVWGYAILFHSVWRDPRHMAHRQVVELWRRTLALAVTRVAWQEQNVNFGISQWFEMAEENQTFVGAAARQRPKLLFPPGEPRQHIAGLLHEGRVIGLLLPALLVLPARELMEQMDQGASGDGGQLGQWLGLEDLRAARAVPPRYDALWTPLVLGTLQAFLAGALQTLRESRNPSPMERDLVDKLVSFAADLRACENPAGRWPSPPLVDDRSVEGALNSQTSPLRVLRRTPIIEDRSSSACYLPLRGGLNSDIQFVYLSPLMARNDLWRHARVFGQRFVADLPGATVTAADRAKLLRDEKIVVLHPDQLLQPKLVHFPDADIGFYPTGSPWRYYLLPVTALALAFYSPEELLERLKIREEGEDSVTIELMLSLGGAERPVSYTEVRTYGRNSPYELVKAQPMTTLAMWPDMLIPELPIELIYQSGSRGAEVSSGESQIQVQRPLTLPVVEGLAAGFKSPSAQPLASGRRPGRQKNWAIADLPSKSGLFRNQLASAVPIEALECTVGGLGGLILVHTRRAAALISARTCRVSVDFGTTNTMVTMRIGNDEPMQQIDTHVWLPRNISGSTADRADFSEATAEFIPPVGGIPRPFVSLVEVRDTNDTDVPFVRTRIPFVSAMSIRGAIERLIKAPEFGVRPVFDLKWEADAEKRQYVVDLLFQVILLIAAHARSQGVMPSVIEWRFTRPRSFTPQIAEQFERNIEQAWQRLFRGRFNSQATIEVPVQKVDFRWESRCIFHYLRRYQPDRFANLVVTLDVGGGSTDIALQQRDGVLWDGSVELAGQSILIDYWTKNFQDLGQLLDDMEGFPLKGREFIECRPAERKALIELLVNETDLVRHVADMAQNGQGSTLPGITRDRARIALLGLVYFVCRFLLEPLAVDKTGEKDRRPIASLLLGGRGCLIFHNLCYHPGSKARLIDADLIAAWFERAGFDREHAAIALSDHIKQEVALGALDAPADNEDQVSAPALTPGTGSWVDSSSRQSTPATTSPPEEGPGFAEFCQLICDRFPRFSGLPTAWDRFELRARLEARAAADVPFGSSDNATSAVDQARHRFFIGLRALLDNDRLLTGDERA